jgi:hypothetical protein
MIHVDVRKTGAGYVVEASTDGAGFATQHVIDVRKDMPIVATFPLAREYAETIARAFANGCGYTGADVRMTSCGGPLYYV